MSTASQDIPGVIAKPPLLYVAALLAGLGLDWLRPLPIGLGLGGVAGGLLPAIAGVALCAVAIRHFNRAATPYQTDRQSQVLVTSGPYRLSRNPIYIGLTTIYAGLALAAGGWWPFVLLPVLLAVMEWGVIRREERYLDARFGQAYRDYRARVRRWL